MSLVTRAILCGLIAFYGVLCLPGWIAKDAACQVMLASGCCAPEAGSEQPCELCRDCVDCCDADQPTDSPIPPPTQPSRSIAGLDWFPIPEPPSVMACDSCHPALNAWQESADAPTWSAPRREMLCVWVI